MVGSNVSNLKLSRNVSVVVVSRHINYGLLMSLGPNVGGCLWWLTEMNL